MTAAWSACGGAKGDDRPTPIPTEAVDPAVVSAALLQPDEVPPGFTLVETRAPSETADGLLVEAVYANDSVTLRCEITLAPDRALQVQAFERSRRASAALIGPEAPIEVAGGDVAYAYQTEDLKSIASLSVKGLATVRITTTPATSPEESPSVQEIIDMNAAVLSRLPELAPGVR